MNSPHPRVVLDTVVFVQALISGRGAAAGCIDLLKAGKFVLLLNDDLLREVREVPLRPELTRKYTHLTLERIEAFVEEICSLGVQLQPASAGFRLQRDPMDEMLIDLAVAGSADFLVTWNERHLTYLMKGDTVEGRDFCNRFPKIHILSPPQFLHQIRLTP